MSSSLFPCILRWLDVATKLIDWFVFLVIWLEDGLDELYELERKREE